MVARIRFTGHLRRFFPTLLDFEAPAAQVAELLPIFERRYPGLPTYLVDDQGALRRHVNCFVDGSPLVDRLGLSDSLQQDSEVFWVQALSGG
jgi:molybdopterin synthase sulfur carrier subunit